MTDLETIQEIQIIATLSLECCKQLKDGNCVLPDDLPSRKGMAMYLVGAGTNELMIMMMALFNVSPHFELLCAPLGLG